MFSPFTLFAHAAFVPREPLPELAPEPAVIRQLSDYTLPNLPEGHGFVLATNTYTAHVTIADNVERPIPKAKPVVLPAESIEQIGNTCGPVSLSIVLRAFGRDVSVEEITKLTECNSVIGTSPQYLRDTAQRYGLHAAVLNDSSWTEVKKLLDSGAYCIALIQSGTALHYEVINGYQLLDDGKIELMITGTSGSQYYTSFENFDGEWQNVTVTSKFIPTGFNRAIIAVSNNKLPNERLAGWANISSWLHGATTSATGYLTTLGERLAGMYSNPSAAILAALASFGSYAGEVLRMGLTSCKWALFKLRNTLGALFGRKKSTPVAECKCIPFEVSESISEAA